jgi:parvulin-like peptidyl-prolyl isomerase
MITLMHKIAPVVFWIVLVTFVGTIFFAWGMDFAQKDRMGNAIGKIGDKKIPLRAFFSQVETERERLRMNTQGEISEQQNRMIPRQVWEREVQRYLHEEMFKQMKLGGTSEEIFNYLSKNPPQEIMNHPHFMTDSVFDTAKFVQFLNTPESFDNPGMLELELQIKNFIVPMLKLKGLVEIGVIPSKDEIAQAYRDQYEKTVFEYAKVLPASFPVSGSEITDAMIAVYYKENPDTFTTDAQAELYFVRMPKVATAYDEKTFYDELIAIKDRVKNGETTFEEEAKAESDDEASAVKGGELGWFSKGMMVPQFEAAVWSLQPGIISDPVKTNFGYHLILVDDREMKKDSVIRIKAKHILRKVIPTGETIDSLEEFVDSLRKVMLEKGIKEAVKGQKDIVVDSTGLFKKGDMVEGIGYLNGMFNFVFPLGTDEQDKEKISERLENDRAFYLLSVKRKTKKGIQPLAAIKDDIIAILRDKLQTEKARVHAEMVYKKASEKQQLSLASLKGTDSLVIFGKTDTVTRKQYIPDIGYDNGAVEVAFALPEGALSRVVETDRSFYIIKPLWKTTVDTIPWDSYQMQQVKMSLSEQNKKNAYMDWYLSYRQSKKIEDYLDKFFE